MLDPHFISEMKSILGSDYPNYEACVLAHEAPTSIRWNKLKKRDLNFPELKNIPWAADAIQLKSRPAFGTDPHFHAGVYYPQEASSMFLHQVKSLLEDKEGPLLALDVCAAPGGKSTLLLDVLKEEDFLITNEYVTTRTHILAENLSKWGRNNVLVCNNSSEDFLKLNGLLDLVLVDAPCSGEGMFRRQEDAIKEWSPENVAMCVERQEQIVSNVMPALKENGILIYSTCTHNRKENEEVVAKIMADGFEEVKVNGDFPGVVRSDLGYRFYPHQVDGEGFYICFLQKKTSERKQKTKKWRHNFKSIKDLPSYLNPKHHYFENESEVISLPAYWSEEILKIASGLNPFKIGCKVASVSKGKWSPEHDLAMSMDWDMDAFQQKSLSLEEAQKYLKGEVVDLSEFKSGMVLMKYEGSILGWMKNLGNRGNNKYPKHWRMR